MVQVKILKNSGARIERDINDFLKEIGSVQGTKVSLMDIKLSELTQVKDMFMAMVIYNQSRVQPTNS